MQNLENFRIQHSYFFRNNPKFTETLLSETDRNFAKFTETDRNFAKEISSFGAKPRDIPSPLEFSRPHPCPQKCVGSVVKLLKFLKCCCSWCLGWSRRGRSGNFRKSGNFTSPSIFWLIADENISNLSTRWPIKHGLVFLVPWRKWLE